MQLNRHFPAARYPADIAAPIWVWRHAKTHASGEHRTYDFLYCVRACVCCVYYQYEHGSERSSVRDYRRSLIVVVAPEPMEYLIKRMRFINHYYYYSGEYYYYNYYVEIHSHLIQPSTMNSLVERVVSQRTISLKFCDFKCFYYDYYRDV
jgi:hypothetical protein